MNGPRAGSSLNTTWARCRRLTEASARARSISLREAARFNPAQPVAVPCLERGLRRVANKVEVPGHGRGFSRVILPTAAVVWCKQRVETTRHESRIHLLLSRNGRALISSTESGPNKAGLACTIFTMTYGGRRGSEGPQEAAKASSPHHRTRPRRPGPEPQRDRGPRAPGEVPRLGLKSAAGARGHRRELSGARASVPGRVDGLELLDGR